jgi:hypothetical protein
MRTGTRVRGRSASERTGSRGAAVGGGIARTSSGISLLRSFCGRIDVSFSYAVTPIYEVLLAVY